MEKKHYFWAALLVGVSSVSLVHATDLKEEKGQGSPSSSFLTLGCESDDEELDALQQQLKSLKQKKKEALRREIAALKEELGEVSDEEEAEDVNPNPKSEEPHILDVSDSDSEDEEDLKKDPETEGKTEGFSDEDEAWFSSVVGQKGITNLGVAEENYYEFAERTLSALYGQIPSNRSGSVEDLLTYAFQKMGGYSSDQKQACSFTDQHGFGLAFFYPVYYLGNHYPSVKLWFSEITRRDEGGNNLTHLQWKFQYNPAPDNSNTHDPHFCYYSPKDGARMPNHSTKGKIMDNLFLGGGDLLGGGDNVKGCSQQ